MDGGGCCGGDAVECGGGCGGGVHILSFIISFSFLGTWERKKNTLDFETETLSYSKAAKCKAMRGDKKKNEE